MDKTDEGFLKPSNENTSPTQEFDAEAPAREVRITDRRVAQLLLVLHEIDICIKGLEQLPEPQLSELVADAIQACGFADSSEARCAIASILNAIEAPDRLNRNYS